MSTIAFAFIGMWETLALMVLVGIPCVVVITLLIVLVGQRKRPKTPPPPPRHE